MCVYICMLILQYVHSGLCHIRFLIHRIAITWFTAGLGPMGPIDPMGQNCLVTAVLGALVRATQVTLNLYYTVMHWNESGPPRTRRLCKTTTSVYTYTEQVSFFLRVYCWA